MSGDTEERDVEKMTHHMSNIGYLILYERTFCVVVEGHDVWCIC